MNKLLIFDTYGMFFRYYYGFRPMYDKNNTNINAVYGFVNGLFEIIKKIEHTHFVLAVDSGGKGIRHEIFPEYKANRGACPEDLVPQFDILDEVLSEMGVNFTRIAGLEADDIINIYVKKCEKNGDEAVVVSSDKDLLQLVSEKTIVYNPAKKDFVNLSNINDSLAGVRADQIADYLALIGDAVDNVPGVHGIGPKTAISLLQKYCTLDGIYANMENLDSDRVKDLLKSGRESAFLSQRLTRLIFDDSLELDLGKMKKFSFNLSEKCIELFEKYSLSAIIRKNNLANNKIDSKKSDNKSVQLSLL